MRDQVSRSFQSSHETLSVATLGDRAAYARFGVSRNRTSTERHNLLPVVAELVFVQEWNELEDEFEERCGGHRMKSLLTHGGRRQTGRQRLDQDGGRQVDLALKDAGLKAQEGSGARQKVDRFSGIR